jgi:hypothetical protein
MAHPRTGKAAAGADDGQVSEAWRLMLDASLKKRKHDRRVFARGYRAVLADRGGMWHGICSVLDISEGGAKLKLHDSQDAPQGELVLILGPNQSPQRACRIVWRKHGELGIIFLAAPKT